jgi:transposase
LGIEGGNRLDGTTVTEVVRDLIDRFAFRRVLFVGDRGMVSEANLAAL